MNPNQQTAEELTERPEELYKNMGLSTQQARETVYGYAVFAE